MEPAGDKKLLRQGRESLYLSERFMATLCVLVVVTGLLSFPFILKDGDYFEIFGVLARAVAAVSLYFAFRSYRWEVAKGLMGTVLCCLMYQEAYLVLGRLWGEEDFDTYLVTGVFGSIYLAAAGMSFLITVIILLNHSFINYARHGNPENVLFNRMAVVFKLLVYALLLIANSRLGFSPAILWENALHYLNDMAILLLVVSIESQFDSFKQLREELLSRKG